MANTILEPQIIKIITQICRDKKVVNLGCGEDPYKPIFKAISREYLTLDIDSSVEPDVVHDLNDGLPREVLDFEPMVIFADKVPEHLKDPDKQIKEWKRVASYLIITVSVSQRVYQEEFPKQEKTFPKSWFKKRDFEVQGAHCRRYPKDFWEGVASLGFIKIPKCDFLLAIYRSNAISNSKLRLLYQKAVDYIKKPLLKFWPDQRDYLNNLLSEKQYSLIILDACRYDYFKKNYRNYLTGRLVGVRSPASKTHRWLESCFVFEDRCNATVYSANPFINSKGLHPINYSTYNGKENFERIVDVWEKGYGNKIGTLGTPPDLVRKTVEQDIKEGNNASKSIIWFAQPHAPWIGKTDLLEYIDESELIGSENTPGYNSFSPAYFARKVIDGTISKRELKKAYEDNLKLVLKEVAKLVHRLKGRIVITSDHGELLGESGAYFHPSYLNYPSLRIVPWLEVEGSKVVPEPLEIEYSNTEKVQIEKRLKELGYL